MAEPTERQFLEGERYEDKFPDPSNSDLVGEALLPVGEHECVTCPRCACTFAVVHPACPSCSAEKRVAQQLEQAEQALRWNMEYAGKMVWMCPSFVYVERESRAALELLHSGAALTTPDSATEQEEG